MRKTIDNVMLNKIGKGKPISAADIHALVEGVKAATTGAIGGALVGAKGHMGANAIQVGGGFRQGRQATGASPWIRCISAVDAPAFSAMEIYDCDFVCSEIRLYVRFAQKPIPKNGPITVCTNDMFTLTAGGNGWVRFVSYMDQPGRHRVGRNGAPRGVAPPKL